MPKLAKLTWFYILEAAKEFNAKPYTQRDIVDKVQQKVPRAKKDTIICILHGMTPNYPSSKTFPVFFSKPCGF